MDYLLASLIAELMHSGASLRDATACAYYELGLDMALA